MTVPRLSVGISVRFGGRTAFPGRRGGGGERGPCQGEVLPKEEIRQGEERKGENTCKFSTLHLFYTEV